MTPTQTEIATQGKAAAAKLAAAQEKLADYDPMDHEWFDGEVEIQESYEWHLHNNVRKAQQELDDLRAEYRATLTARETVVVGWDGRSKPMLRYRDEMHLPEYRRAVAVAS